MGKFVSFLLGRGQNNADVADGNLRKILGSGQFVAQLLNGFLYPVTGLLADAGVVVANPGYGGGGNACVACNIFYGNSQKNQLISCVFHVCFIVIHRWLNVKQNVINGNWFCIFRRNRAVCGIVLAFLWQLHYI